MLSVQRLRHMIFYRGRKRVRERRKNRIKKEENLRDMKSYIVAGSNIRKVWMIRGCQRSQRAALLTASTTSLVWPSSSMPPLLTAK